MQIVQKINKRLAAWGDKRIERIQSLIRSVPEGVALLDLAKAAGVPIRFDPRLQLASTVAALVNPVPSEGNPTYISLNPFAGRGLLAKSLVHELRHLWQYQQLENPQKVNGLPFEDNAGFFRFTEADAFVFENYMAARIQLATDADIPYRSSPDPGGYRATVSIEDAAAGKNLHILYENFQASKHVKAYDSSVLDLFNKAAFDTVRGVPFAQREAALKKDLPRWFTTASFAEVGDINKLPVITIDGKEMNYLGALDNDKPFGGVWDYIRSPAMKEARQRFKVER